MKKKILTAVAVMFVAFIVTQPLNAKADWRQTAKGNYYYIGNNGKKVKGRWIGDYYLNSKGYMVKNKWVVSNGTKYFVGADGKWIPNFRKGWYQIGKKWYYYTSSGKMKTGFFTVKGKKYYCNSKGIMLTGLRKISGKRYYFDSSGAMKFGFRTVKGNRYYFRKTNKDGYAFTGLRKMGGKYYYFSATGIMQKGWQTVNNAQYYFQSDGKSATGWENISGNTYYFTNKGIMVKGLQNIDGALYYFGDNGIMYKNTTITVNGVTYQVDASGKCNQNVNDPSGGGSVSQEMLFFTKYESGPEAYGQTGGDNGNACGKYQFDYRYSLLPLVKYCYSKDPVTFKEFQPYAAYALTEKNKAKLKGNQKFFRAWQTIYARAPRLFASYQDEFAKQEYYDETERYLMNMGINIKFRPDVVKGSVFSYSIQHGAYSAALAVKAAGINNGTSNRSFINKLYTYRISNFPLYRTRYNSEKAEALSYL